MPKGEYSTPGPFTREGNMLSDNRRSRNQWVARFEPMEVIDNAEADELVGLLNKGTHFEAMLEALKMADAKMDEAYVYDDEGEFEDFDEPKLSDAWQAIRQAIAAAEGQTQPTQETDA